MKTLIIEDDLFIRSQLRQLLSEAFPVAEIIGEATSFLQARRMIREYDPQLAFIAADLPDGSGFDLLPADSQAIFLLEADHQACKALQFSRAPHLTKPLKIIDFYKVLLQTQQRTFKRQGPSRMGVTAKHNHRIALPKTNGFEFIPVAPIVYCAAEKDHCLLHLDCGRVVYTTKSIKEMAMLLENYGFSRVHRSHLVNLNQIKRYFKGEGGKIKMSNDAVIDVSRRCKKTFLQDLRTFHML